MKKVLAFCMLIMIAGPAFSQRPEWGRSQQAEKKSFDPTVVGEDEDAIYTADIERNTLYLGKYDKQKMARKYAKTLELPAKGKKEYSFEAITFVQENFVLFASYYDRKSKTFELSAFTIDGSSARYKKDELLFRNEVEKKRRKGNFKIFPSKNRETILAYYAGYSKKKDQTTESFKLLSSELETLVEKSVVIEGSGTYSTSNFIVDDEGSVYYIRDAEVVILDANSDFEEWSQKIDVEGLQTGSVIDDIFMSLNANNDPVVIGSYITTDYKNKDQNKRRREKRDGDTQVEGMFFMRIDGLTKETMVSRLTKFDQDYIDQFKSRKDIKKDRDAEINQDYNRFDFYYKDDGGVVFVGESTYTVQYYRDGRLVGENYYYMDLVTYNFSPEGELIWAHRIPKYQLFAWRSSYLGFNTGSYGWSWMTIPFYTRGSFSYLAGLSDDKLYIVFNDNPKNANATNESDKLKPYARIKKGVPTMYTIDLESGVKKKKMERSFAKGDEKLRPANTFQAAQNEPMYIFAIHKKNYRFGKVDFGTAGEVKGKSKRRK